ncbi:MAG: C45 family peptidase, partial [Candidatus Glassbacteria bacterium]
MLKSRCFILILTFLLPAAELFPSAGALDADERKWLSRASRTESEGWIFLHIEGSPFERGFQHGYLLAPEIKKVFATERHLVYWEYPKDFELFVEVGKRLFDKSLDPELKAELRGMAAGLEKAGIDSIGYDQILAHNAFMEVLWYWWPWAKQSLAARTPAPLPVGCSAFIATGSYTADSGIVMGHNSWVDYALGSSFNVILDLQPDQGHRMIMQTLAGYIHSGSDFFVCSSGLVGCETTIGDYAAVYDTTGTAEFCRVRRAMQYARTIDEWAEIMVTKNSGGYANSWLVGDVNSGEVARLELGTKFHKLEKTKDGYFAGSNIAEDRDLLLNETGTNFSDIRKSNVARKVSWQRLMKKNRGRIDAELAKAMLADHYDSYLGSDTPG